MTIPDDLKYITRCLELASKAEGLTYPNPMVGSVIVNDGRIIGEGFHIKSGGPHAEVIAIESVKDTSLLKSSTIYVNLEPCSHYGKTPPCADLIIASGIPRVVIGTTDTNEKVSGMGIARLKKAGCEVITGIAEAESRKLNRRFFTYHEQKRPYIILKWAQSSDGFIDVRRKSGETTGPNWISGKAERVLVHRWRAAEQSILIGAGTLRTDHPKLNVRDWKGNDPLKLVLSSSGDIKHELEELVNIGTTIVFTHRNNVKFRNTEIVILKKNIPEALQVSDWLFKKGIQSLIVEGGSEILNLFIKEGLWDEARIFTGKQIFGNGITGPLFSGEKTAVCEYSGSTLTIFAHEGT
jgi:diaminohydroxyphosphoribosylaminopyrimidine deaminase / 5-amino-6-(5-phosphoribosylamino)uracil reductase